MKAVLGVEGGGLHSHAVVANSSGEVLGVGASHDPSNWEDVGIEAAGGALKSCVRSALNVAGASPESLYASVFSLAGVDFPVDERRLGGIPEALGLTRDTRIMNDAFAALRAGTDTPFGVVVSAGTGSIVAGRNPAGEEFRTLGLGPTFGDWGSASEISEAAVRAVAEEFTGRGQATALAKLLCADAGSASVVEFIEGAGRGRIDPSGFARIVVRAAGEGDAVARGILMRAGETLGATAAHIVRSLAMEELEFDLVLAGGMFRSGSRDLMDALERTVGAVAPGARPVRLDTPAVVGSVLLALELGGEMPNPDVRAALSEGTISALHLPVH